MHSKTAIRIVECHAEGEVGDVIVGGISPPPGDTLWAQSRFIAENQNLRNVIKEYSDWPTIPQLYIKKEFVGGCDIIKEMFENGELKKTLDDKGISFKK